MYAKYICAYMVINIIILNFKNNNKQRRQFLSYIYTFKFIIKNCNECDMHVHAL